MSYSKHQHVLLRATLQQQSAVSRTALGRAISCSFICKWRFEPRAEETGTRVLELNGLAHWSRAPIMPSCRPTGLPLVRQMARTLLR